MLAVLKKLKYISSAKSYTHEEMEEDHQLLAANWA